MRLLLVGLLVLLMGCSAGERSLAPEENKVLYPGAPIVSIKKTKLEDGRLFFRIEAQELVPYDIEVRVEGTRDGDRRINESIEMRAGRSVVGTDISLGQNDTTVTLWIELWHGIGDAPYNVGSPSRLTVAYDAPVQVVRTTSDVMNDQLLEVYFNKPPQGLSVEGASEHTVLDTKVVITGRSCRGNIILMWAGGRENLFYDNCPPPPRHRAELAVAMSYKLMLIIRRKKRRLLRLLPYTLRPLEQKMPTNLWLTGCEAKAKMSLLLGIFGQERLKNTSVGKRSKRRGKVFFACAREK